MKKKYRLKKEFRVVEFHKGFITLWKSQVKTIFGWVTFNADRRGYIEIWISSGSSINKQDALNNIENYCKANSILENEIVITEISKQKKFIPDWHL